MLTQTFHEALPRPSHDELSRQNFVKSLKLHLATRVAPGNRIIYEARIRPAFESRSGRPPADAREVRSLMAGEPYYRLWSSLQRTSQELMWDAIVDTVEREHDGLREKVRRIGSRLGTLRTDPGFVPPRYVTAVDIHCMPGGYCSESGEDDVAAGALFDRHGDVYSSGAWGPLCDSKGRRLLGFLDQRFPELRPRRILELGCGVGHSLLPYAEAYPQAEIHGIDISAPLLRYAHARAEALGKAVHFSQQNAEAMTFPDGHFDLVVSHVLLHETSGKAVRRILQECRRVLAAGGVMAHWEMQTYHDMPPYDAFMLDWDTYNNNEPFWSALRQLDPVSLMAEAGFEQDRMFQVIGANRSPWSPVPAGIDTNGRGGELVFGSIR